MSANLRPIDEQVIVITGASSGIGLQTALSAADKRAKLVLGARSKGTLDDLVEELTSGDVEAIAVECDVTDRRQLERLAEAAISRFGRIDTWVNNAGLGMYGRIEESEESASRRLFDINFWGLVNGSLVALPYLRQNGGVLINVGSEVSEAAVPLLGMYAASKHAVKGFTDALRIEVEEIDKAPVVVTLIQPTAVDTPFPEHAKNFMDKEPKLPSPMIEAEQVAEAILTAAASPTRAKKVGMMAKVNTTVAKLAPALSAKLAAKMADRQQHDEQPRNPDGILYQSSEKTGVAGRTKGTSGVEPAA